MKTGVTKEQLIKSLADTLRLTRIGIEDLVLLNTNTVQIKYEGGGTKNVNIAANSGIAIIRDVAKYVG